VNWQIFSSLDISPGDTRKLYLCQNPERYLKKQNIHEHFYRYESFKVDTPLNLPNRKYDKEVSAFSLD